MLLDRTIKNSLSGALQMILNSILVFFTIPIFIRLLGSEQYGVWALVMVIGNLNVFTNLGLDTALTKFLAEQGKSNESNLDIMVSIILLLGLIIILNVPAIIFHKAILIHILDIPKAYISDSVFLFIFQVLSASLFLVGGVFRAILAANHNIFILNYIRFCYSLIYWGLIITVVIMGYGLKSIGLVTFISAFFWFCLIIIYASKYWKDYNFKDFKLNFKRIIKKQILYSTKIYTGGLLRFLYEPLMKILISKYFGVTEVGFYDIATRCRDQAIGLFNKILYPLFPIIAQQKDINRIKNLIKSLENKLLLFIFPNIVIIIFITIPAIELWIGKNVIPIAYSVIGILSINLISNVTIEPTYHFLTAKGYAEKTIYLQLSRTIGNILLFYLFYTWTGFNSVIIANIGSSIIYYIFAKHFQSKYLNLQLNYKFKTKMKLLFSIFINVIIGLAIYSLCPIYIAKIGFIFVSITGSSLITYRLLGLFDIRCYLHYFRLKPKLLNNN